MNEVMLSEQEASGISNVELWAKSLTVTTPEEHDNAMTRLREIKVLVNKIKDFFKPSKEAASKAHKEICKNESMFLDRLLIAEGISKQKLMAYQMEQEKLRQAEQIRLQAEVDEAARKERIKLELQARKAEASGKTEKAEALKAQAQIIEAPVIAVASSVNSGGSAIIKKWKAKVVDIKQLPRDWMIVNDELLQSFARSTKGQIPVAGVEFYEDTIMSVRTK